VIFYAGKFVKPSQPGHNVNYRALWAGSKLYKAIVLVKPYVAAPA